MKELHKRIRCGLGVDMQYDVLYDIIIRGDPEILRGDSFIQFTNCLHSSDYDN